MGRDMAKGTRAEGARGGGEGIMYVEERGVGLNRGSRCAPGGWEEGGGVGL